MPGPMSTPMGWTPKLRRNTTGSHGTPATETRPRRSGKTAWTHASGQWAHTRSNKIARTERQRKSNHSTAKPTTKW